VNDPITVLVVDDHAIVRRGIRALLSTKKDIKVVGEASDGGEAIAQALALKPDIVLMDLMMPGKSGIEATHEIAAALPGTKVLVLTSFAGDEHVFPAIKAGALGYLLKDTAPEDLVQALRRAHEGTPPLDASVARRLLDELAAPAPPHRAADPLTPREMAVLREVAKGHGNRDIAAHLSVSEETVHTHVSSILAKLHLASRTQAALYALKEGLAAVEDIPARGQPPGTERGSTPPQKR